MILLDNKLFVDIKIDGTSVGDQPSFLGNLALTEGNNTPFPACSIQLNDMLGTLTGELNLVDGASIVITVGQDHSDVSTVTRQYRVFGSRAPTSVAGSAIKIVGIYDAPNFTTANVRESYKGPTSAVLKDLADKCILTYDGPTSVTKDEQVWLNICKSRSAFVQEIARHGYIDDHSAMNTILTSLGVLKYKNFMELIEQEPSATLSHNVLPITKTKGKNYIVKQSRPSAASGLVNAWQNYGSTKLSHSLSGTTVVEDKVDVKTTASFLPINTQVARTVESSRVEYSTLDCSNVFDKYERARYQNLRLLGLFCMKTSCLIMETSDIQLYDVVAYRQADADFSIPAEPSDKYIVVGKTIFVKSGKTYAERLELVRMSTNSQGQSKLATQDPATLRTSVAPDSEINPTLDLLTDALSIVKAVTGIYAAIKNPTLGCLSQLSSVSSALVDINPTLGSMADLVSRGVVQTHIPTATSLLQQLLDPAGALVASVEDLTYQYTGSKGVISTLATCYSQVQAINNPVLQRQPVLGVNALLTQGGAVDALCLALPSTQGVANSLRVINTIHSTLNSPSLSGAFPQDHLGAFNDHVYALNTGYQNLSTATCDLWNNCFSIANNQQLDTPQYADHYSTVNNLATVALASPAFTGRAVTQVQDTKRSIAEILTLPDKTGNVRTIATTYETGEPRPLQNVSAVTHSELPLAMLELTNSANRLAQIPVDYSLTQT